jgi:uncharacterized OB-fold protein
MESLPQRPVPVPDELTAPYWEAAAGGTLVIQRCAECTRYQHPPATICLRCGSNELAFEPVSGGGTIYTYTITYDARTPAFAARQPYAVVWVALDEEPGVRLLTNMPDTPLEDVRIGARVEVYFDELTADVKLPQFRLAE